MSLTVDDPAMRLANLLELLADSVVIRPNGDTFQVVRENGTVRCLPVDVDALVSYRPRSAIARPVPRFPLAG
jgi:hypothetical protein